MAWNWLRAAGWWVADYNYAFYGQARGFFNGLDPQTLHAGDREPVVVVPGVYESWRFLLPLVSAVHERGHPVYVIPALRRNTRPVPEAAAELVAILGEQQLEHAIILAHSKGGLIGKHAMLEPEGGKRVAAMLAVATPFGGSVYARAMIVPSLRMFSPHDATIRALALDQSVNSRIVSVYGRFDPHIPVGSELEGAKNVELDTGGHFRILAHERVMEELVLLAP